MEKDTLYSEQSKKKDGVTILILDKVDFFRAKDISKNKGCH